MKNDPIGSNAAIAVEAYTIWTADEVSNDVRNAMIAGIDKLKDNAGGVMEAQFVCDPNNENIIGIEIWMPSVRKGAKVSRVLEGACYEAFGKIVKLAKDVSKNYGIEMAVCIDGEDIGWIKDGQGDAGLEDGLLKEWEKIIYGRSG